MDTIETIKCPACGKEMEKVFILSEGINIDICTHGCGGIFFDNREFERFNEENEDIEFIEQQLKDKKFEKVDENKERICPACGAKMVKNTTSVNGTVVDDCYICGGKFLDYGELTKIRNEFKNDSQRQDAAMKYLYDKVGQELRETEANDAKRKMNKTVAQKLFYSLLDIKD